MINRKKNNKGFSLIELIIVIAIMAVLTAILAPQLLRYVERSREARDRQNIQAVYEAFQLAIIEEGVTISEGSIYYNADGKIASIGPTLKAQFKLIFGEAGDRAPTNPDNKEYWVEPLVSRKYRQTVNRPKFTFKWNNKAISDYIIVTYDNPVP